MISVSVVLLAYKEADNLDNLIPLIKENINKVDGIDYEIIIIDGMKSIDNTEQVCEKHGVKYYNQKYKGFGGAMKSAFEYANKDCFLIMDADCSHDPKYIPDMIDKMVNENCDVVIGSRYTKGGKNQDAAISVIMSRILNNIFYLAIGHMACDMTTDFRIYKTSQLKSIEINCINYDVVLEILLKLKVLKPDLKVAEIPIFFNKRKFGKSKRNLLLFSMSYIKSFFKFLYIRATS